MYCKLKSMRTCTHAGCEHCAIYRLGSGSSDKAMLLKEEELSSDPQDSHKKLRVVVGACNSRVAKTGESLRLTGQQVWPAKMPGRVQWESVLQI